MSNVILTGYILVPASDLSAVRQALPEHIAATEAEAGCLSFQVVEDPAEPGRFDVCESFIDQAAFDAHQTRSQSSDWGRITQNIERHYTIQTLSD